MKILIDTNILIHLEDNKIINERFSEFYKLATSNGCHILYHKDAILMDISKDKDTNRQKIIKSKLNKYEELLNPAELAEEFNITVGCKKDNDKIDNMQLYQLHLNYVNIFVTEDNGIHEKAKKLCLQDVVLNINTIHNLLKYKFTTTNPTHPILELKPIRKIQDKFESSFFDSLREDYGKDNFNNWLRKCVIEDRQCYTLTANNNKIEAILIYNVENTEAHKLPNIYNKVLKICTFKVDASQLGKKLGELFLNKMFEYCINNQIKHLYITVYQKQESLIKLLSTFGFYELNSADEDITEIKMIKNLDKTKIKTTTNTSIIHPFYIDNYSISKFVIPIKPDYYNNLFIDVKSRQATLFDGLPEAINKIEGNTIEKAYISNSKITNLKQGDLLFFYASKENKKIEPVGILETIQIVKNFDDLLTIVAKKTVFSRDQLSQKFDEKKELNVITFRLILYLTKKIDYSRLKKMESFKNNIITITKITETDYQELKNEKYFNQCYIID